MFAAGHSNGQITTQLGISEGAAETCRARMMEKMEARSPVQLVHMALVAGVTSEKP